MVTTNSFALKETAINRKIRRYRSVDQSVDRTWLGLNLITSMIICTVRLRMNGLANDKDNVNREAICIPSPYLPILSVETATTDTTSVDVRSTWTNIEEI